MAEEILKRIEGGWAPIKQEYLLSKEELETLTAEKLKEPILEVAAETDGQKERKRGQDKKREKKMAHARNDMRKSTVRLCPSVTLKGRICKFGDKCTAEHSVEKFMEQKPEDIGPDCPLFNQVGKCQFSFACRFGKSHTNGLEQIEKEPDLSYKPTLNTNYSGIQIAMRKHQYDFSRSDKIVKELPAAVTAMDRERPKLNMRDLSGKAYLAPLTTVGNLPFRRLCTRLGAQITCSEMAVATSILQGNPSEWSLLKRHPSEKVFGVQLVGGYPDSMTKAAQIITDELDVDFIDINLGCPIDVVNEKGGGCMLAQRSNKLLKVVYAMSSVMRDMPLTVKLRYGIKEGKREAHHVMKRLVETCPPAMITLHPRSKEQRYSRLAEWDYVPQCAEAIGGKVPFWVCGDVISPESYYDRLQNFPIDGVMVGRGALIKPWIFKEIEDKQLWDISATERLDICKEFVNYGLEHWGSDDTGVETTRRFMLEWLSFSHRYVPIGLLEVLPPKINARPPGYKGRNELETLLGSSKSSDWVKITEMFLGKPSEGFLFAPKHKANAY
uniref:tRNA-dihydrouridine(47) synthase [NAD(P)(+)] n=1 Tax=Panagrolaimus superbus TaxID=310955 RepID=A0A914YTX3_9BILA